MDLRTKYQILAILWLQLFWIQKVSKVKNKSPDNFKYIITQEVNKSMAENFEARLRQANLVNKNDSDNKLTSFNKQSKTFRSSKETN